MLRKLILLFFLVSLSQLLPAQSDFELVKQRVFDEMLKMPVDDNRIAELVTGIGEDGRWPDINYVDLSNTGFENANHLRKTMAMSVAYNTKSSEFYHQKKMSSLINKSVAVWCESDYICENWWFNQIFTPQTLASVLLLMEDQIDPEVVERARPIMHRANLDAPGARPGGDRIKIGGIAAKIRLVVGDENGFAEIMSVINDEIKFSTGNRGMQQDYSFHHRVDRVNTTYSYGGSYASAFAEWAYYVAGTAFAFSDEKIRQLVDYYLDGICKQQVYGIYTDKGVYNRGISRKERFGPAGTSIPERLLTATDYRKEELEEIIRLREGTSEPGSSFCKFFWQTEHFVFQRPHFYTSVRMYSLRNRNMEEPYNSEGLKNHHKGDGANFLSLQGDEYLNIWPVYDWQKIPGSTVLQKEELPAPSEIQKDGLTGFVGAVTNGLYGAVGFDFISPHDFIKARKSWFFFDNEYVCLGAGIEANSGFPVVSTLNQTLLEGDVKFRSNGTELTLSSGDHELNEVNWVFHNGVGYIFPEPLSIHVSNKAQSGSWFEISKQWSSAREPVQKDVFSLWMDHGVRPQGRRGGLRHESMVARDVTYQYMVVPGVGSDALNEERGIDILANNRHVQAVIHRELGIIQAILYKAGTLKVSENIGFALDSPGAVMLKIVDDLVKEITVSDPSRLLSHLHMKVSGLEENQMNDLSIDLPTGFFAGQSVIIRY